MALIFYGHLVHEHPHLHPRCLPLCPPWGVLGVTRAGAPGTAQWLRVVRVRRQRQSWVLMQWPGKLGSYFSFYFYLGTQACPRCNAEAPRGRAGFPSWSQIPSARCLPFPVGVPDLLVEGSVF